jgi:hypothetical protein
VKFLLFERSVVSRPVDVGLGQGCPIVAGALVELERKKAMGGGDIVVGGKGGIDDA